MQIQMALASLLIIGVFAVVADFQRIIEYGLWHGFDGRAVVAVVSSALGGLIVSAVLKYADSVLKGYASACAAHRATAPFSAQRANAHTHACDRARLGSVCRVSCVVWHMWCVVRGAALLDAQPPPRSF